MNRQYEALATVLALVIGGLCYLFTRDLLVTLVLTPVIVIAFAAAAFVLSLGAPVIAAVLAIPYGIVVGIASLFSRKEA